MPWLYNYIGQPWKTQQLVDRVRSTLFGPTPDGEPGNDDLGAMSAWYVWAAMGLYPVYPGTGLLTVNAPLFDRVEIAFPPDKFIRIFRAGASGHHRHAVHQRVACQRAVDRQDVSAGSGLIEAGGELAFSLSIETQQDLGDRCIVGAAVVWCGQSGCDRECFTGSRRRRSRDVDVCDGQRAADDRRAWRLHDYRKGLRRRNFRGASVREVR